VAAAIVFKRWCWLFGYSANHGVLRLLGVHYIADTQGCLLSTGFEFYPVAHGSFGPIIDNLSMDGYFKSLFNIDPPPPPTAKEILLLAQ
jgi:hypothetical protein